MQGAYNMLNIPNIWALMFSEALDSQLEPQVQGCSMGASVKVLANLENVEKGRLGSFQV